MTAKLFLVFLARLAACAALALAGVTQAAEPEAAAETAALGAVAALDQSGNGSVELTEYQTYQAAVFRARDADNSATLVFAEFEATLSDAARANARPSFDAFDADRDAVLSPIEYAGYQEFVFVNFIDANKDGSMTAEDFARLAGTAGSGGSGGSAAGLMALDRDRSGAVEAEEFMAWQSRRFASLDLDQSGSLSLVEFRKSLDDRAARNARASFDGFDFNKNRRLSDREFVTYHAFVFQKFLDRDGSGGVTAAEWAEIAGRNN